MTDAADINRAGEFAPLVLHHVTQFLDVLGYAKVGSFEFNALKEQGRPVYATNCELGRDVFGQRRMVDVVLYHPQLHPECRVILCW